MFVEETPKAPGKIPERLVGVSAYFRTVLSGAPRQACHRTAGRCMGRSLHRAWSAPTPVQHDVFANKGEMMWTMVGSPLQKVVITLLWMQFGNFKSVNHKVNMSKDLLQKSGGIEALAVRSGDSHGACEHLEGDHANRKNVRGRRVFASGTPLNKGTSKWAGVRVASLCSSKTGAP